MTLTETLALFSMIDALAIGLLFLGWAALSQIIEHPPASRPSVSTLMAQYRRDWMMQMVDRQMRMFDAQTLSTLRQGTSFFASATMIAIGGCLALLGNMERLIGVATDLSLDRAPVIVWEVKLFVTLTFLANAFLKFVWSHRLFGYCSVLMAAVPNDPKDTIALPRASKAAEINITAARGFNRGLRAVYFALASTAWLIGPEALIGAVLLTAVVLLRREFASQSRAILLLDETHPDHTQS